MLFVSLATSYSHRGKPPTTIGAKELNFRVRYGNGCDLFAIATRLYFFRRFIPSKLDNRQSSLETLCLASAPSFSAASTRSHKSKTRICMTGSPPSLKAEQSLPHFIL